MKRSGFTLLEMILVLVVITIAIFPLVESFSSGIIASKDITNTNIAIELAQQKAEQLQTVSFASIVSSSEALGSIPRYPNFSREAVVSEPLTNLKQVNIKVYWKSGPKNDFFDVSTYFVNY